MNAKYFTAESQEAAKTLAMAHFACGSEELLIDVISGGEEGGTEPCQILAIQDALGEANHMNAFYTLYYESTGVYLEIYAQRGTGGKLDVTELMHHLSRKKIVNVSLDVAQALANRGTGRAKIATEQREFIYGEDLNIVVKGDETEVSVRLLAPEPNGKALSLDEAKMKLRDAGVIHGIDEAALTNLLEAKTYDSPRIAARATPPIEGEDGKLTFHFSTDERTGAPRELGCGRVDYRSLDLYVPVTENQLLVTRTPATEGMPGTSVKGNSIKQRVGKEATMPRGKNIRINPEKTEMVSTCAGMVEVVNNAINVSSVYSVNGDCDMSVGNIDFDGSVQISGSVRSGHTIKATGGITVGGAVEAATLIAGGNVEIKGGMQGAGKGMIEAGGSVTVLYVERGTIAADGPITVDVSIHSKIETGSTIHAIGKRGAIIGGQAGAAGDIVANYIGALSHTKTDIEVGFMPRKRARIATLESEMERLAADMVKLDQLDTYLGKSKGTMDPETWNKLYRSGVENRRINDGDISAIAAEMEILRDELEHATSSKVHIFETAFAGSRIVIGSSAYRLNDEITFATFKYNDGEVTYGVCELNKADIKV